MSKIKLNKVEVKVINKVEKKIDKRKFNTGRPVNKKSARYIRLQQQSWYETINAKFVNGNEFKINNSTYKYSAGKNNTLGCIVDGIGSHACNVSYIGRTKVQGYKFVLGKKVNVELNLKTLQFVK
jgi:hypothetical protein